MTEFAKSGMALSALFAQQASAANLSCRFDRGSLALLQ